MMGLVVFGRNTSAVWRIVKIQERCHVGGGALRRVSVGGEKIQGLAAVGWKGDVQGKITTTNETKKGILRE